MGSKGKSKGKLAGALERAEHAMSPEEEAKLLAERAAPKARLRQLWPYIRPHQGAVVVVLVLTLLGSGVSLAQPLVAMDVIERLEVGSALATPLLVLVVLIVLSALLTASTTWLGERVSQTMVIRVRKGLIHRLIRLRVGEVDKHTAGNLTTRVTSDSQLLQQASSSGLIQILDGGLTMVAAVAIMLFLDPLLFGVTVGVLVVMAVATVFAIPGVRRSSEATQEAVGEVGQALERSLGAARTVKANGAEGRETGTATKAVENAYEAAMRGARYHAVIGVLSGMAVQVTFLAVIGVGGALVATGAVGLGVLVAFLLFLFRLIAPLFLLLNGVTQLFQGLGALRRIEDVQDMPQEEDVDRPVEPTSGPAPRVDLESVTFTYPGRDTTLDGIAFGVPAGTQTALVGPSGAGKTTVFGLLQRFYDQDEGALRIDGTDIRAIDRATVRSQIAYVEQESPVMAGTLRDNLCYGAPEAEEDALVEALSKARLTELVDRLPQGLDTPVGSQGSALSGGERQRLAIARALLRRPRVLLMDEATSNMDAVNEEALRQTLLDVQSECTILLIAHRLSTVVEAEQIVVMEEGRVRATGSHHSLLATDDLYRSLAETQFVSGNRLAAEDLRAASTTPDTAGTNA